MTSCCFNSNGNIFAYSVSYDWSKVIITLLISYLVINFFNIQGHEHYNPSKKNYIFLRQASEDLKPRKKK